MTTKADAPFVETVVSRRRSVEAELRLTRRRLRTYEKRHGFSSAVFVKRFESGKLGDDREWFEWFEEWVFAKALEKRLAAKRSPS